jgi:AcrR family transcriptional regulator
MAGPGKYDRSLSGDERKAQRREQVLEAATAVFAERGIANTRVDDLVTALGISRRTLYEDFGSIETIVELIYDRAVRESFVAVATRIAAARDPIDRIVAGISAYFEIIAANPAAARMVFDEYRHVGPAQAAKYEVNTTRYVSLMLDMVTAAFAAGQLRHAPDEVTIYALIKAAEAIGVRALRRGEDAAALAPAMARLVIAAFNAPDR